MGNRVSFRDPSGILLAHEGRILRFVYESGCTDLELFMRSEVAQDMVKSGVVVSSNSLEKKNFISSCACNEIREMAAANRVATILEHERIPFPSFPYEWSPAMLYAAATLTLELAERLLKDGIGIKDATPYNVLFRGPKPVFVDLLSFEARDATDPTWLPFAQFMRTFFLPILVNAYFGVPLAHLFITRRDGMEPEEVYRMCSPLRRLFPPFFFHVSIPVWLSSKQTSTKGDIYRKRSLKDPEQARFILGSLFRRLRKNLGKITPERIKESQWSGYMESHSYSSNQFESKHDFVSSAIKKFSPASVLDVGCNTGYFSALAARNGARVTAIDYDPTVIDHVWQMANEQHLDILPLVVNLGRPSPAVGWLNKECPSFLERAIGSFDAVFMLAVVHHLLVTDQIPLDDIVDLAAELTNELLIVEFVAPQDEMFRRIARGRDYLYEEITTESFIRSCSRHFDLADSMHVEGTHRWLYSMKKRSSVRNG